LATCLYAGRVDHVRHRPRHHRFDYRMLMLYLDLGSMDRDLARFPWLMGRWFSPLRFRREDHMGGDQQGSANQPLEDCVRHHVAAETGARPQGPIRLLTGFGFMAHRFNPVSFYYCFDWTDTRLEAVVAEVTNTPWGERHYYVLDARNQPSGQTLLFDHSKGFHVSPFMPMDTHYHWRIQIPADRFALVIAVEEGGEELFSAGLRLQERPFTRAQLLRGFLLMPFTSLKVVAAIHWQALRLWLKSAPFHSHPKDNQQRAVPSEPLPKSAHNGDRP